MPIIIKCFPEWYDNTGTGGIFKDIATGRTETFTWLVNAGTLDMEYFGNKSGNKSVSPIIEKFIEQNIDAELQNPFVLTTAQRTALANIIVNRYSEKWQKLYALLSKEYNPIENYSMTETETPNITKRQGVSSDYAVSDEKKTGTNYSVSTDSETTAEAYGFNSASPVPTNDASGNSTVTTIGNADENVETNTHKQTGYTEETETGTRELTRSGNIGVTTSQQMIESEIALWQWNFIESVYKDVDMVLTVPKYEI